MKNIKVILSTILILIINLFVGCSNINEKKEEKLDLFDVFKGKDLAINYLINIRNGDISSAVNNCESEILESNINLSYLSLFVLSIDPSNSIIFNVFLKTLYSSGLISKTETNS